jgi:hypothetical protein
VLPGATLNLGPIQLSANDIREHNHGGLGAVTSLKRRVGEPAFRRQKYENQDQHTQHIPLPRRARISPEGDLFGRIAYETHNCHLMSASIIRATLTLCRGKYGSMHRKYSRNHPDTDDSFVAKGNVN